MEKNKAIKLPFLYMVVQLGRRDADDLYLLIASTKECYGALKSIEAKEAKGFEFEEDINKIKKAIKNEADKDHKDLPLLDIKLEDKVEITPNIEELKDIQKLREPLEKLEDLWKIDVDEVVKRLNPEDGGNGQRIKRIMGFDLPVKIRRGKEIEKRIEQLLEERAVGLLIDLSKDENKRPFPIYRRVSVILGEMGTYHVAPLRVDKEGNVEILKDEIKLSREKSLSRFIRPSPWRKGVRNIDFGGGLYEGRIHAGKFTLPVLIFPYKLEPREAEKIINDLIKEPASVEKPERPSGLSVNVGDVIRKSPLMALLQTIRVFEGDPHGSVPLKKSLKAILADPDKALVTVSQYNPIEDVRIPDMSRLMDPIFMGHLTKVGSEGHFSFGGNQYRFTRAYSVESRITYNTYPNRFVKYFLKFAYGLMVRGLKALEEKALGEEDGELVEFVRNKVRDILHKDIIPLLNAPWMEEVEDMTHLAPPPQKLLQNEFYSDVFYNYLDLVRQLEAYQELDELLMTPVDNMPALYQKWCELKLRKIAEELGLEFETERRFGRNGKDWFSYSLPLVPDFTLKKENTLILMDAKYRVDFVEYLKEAEEENGEIKDNERRGTFKLGDIYKMHTYREAIRRKDGCRPIWVIALYPGDEMVLYREDGVKYSSEEDNLEEFLNSSKGGAGDSPKGGVGAISLKPEKEDKKGGVGAISLKPGGKWAENLRNFLRIL